jgi:LmbE family N-acetylglucosaminyl deacetylase
MVFLKARLLSILAIGAHPDDIELGAGGFLYRLVHELEARVVLLILTQGLKSAQRNGGFDRGQRSRESIEAAGILGVDRENVKILGFEDCGLHNRLHPLIESIEETVSRGKFDLVLTHAAGDTHHDHATSYHATISATREFEGTILLYQVPSTVLNEFRPTFFANLEPEEFDAKFAALQRHVSQREKPFMSEEQVRAVAQSWGALHRASGRLFEAFEVYKTFWC